MAEIKEWNHTLLWTNENQLDIDHLLEIYGRDRHRARVVFMNSHGSRFTYERVIVFEDPDSEDFDIVKFRVKYGISTTNIKYRHSKRMITLRYRKETGFWLCHKNSITRPMSLNPHEFNGIQNFMMERFAWYRSMVENNIQFNFHLTPQKIMNKRLFSFDKILKHYYGFPIQTCKTLFEFGKETSHSDCVTLVRTLRLHSKFLDKVENLKKDWLVNHLNIFVDSMHMAKTLGKKINCSWGVKRLYKEHDDWAEEISRIIFIEDERDLGNRDVYTLFAKENDYQLINTTRELAEEGIKMQHCVGSYASKVDGGQCSIFHIKGHTLQLGYEETFEDKEKKETHFILKNKQFKGVGNTTPPSELIVEVENAIDEFNTRHKGTTNLIKSNWHGLAYKDTTNLYFDLGDDDLPF